VHREQLLNLSAGHYGGETAAFVDIGDLSSTRTGATFGYQMMCGASRSERDRDHRYSEMSGRIDRPVSGRRIRLPVRESTGFAHRAFDWGVRRGIVNLMTLAAEVGGVAIGGNNSCSGLPYRWLIVLAVVAFADRPVGRVAPVDRADLRHRSGSPCAC